MARLRGAVSVLPKQPGERAERFTAMAACVLFLGGKLRRGDVEAGRLEDGVVAESAGSARRAQDAPFPRPVRDEWRGIMAAARECDDALIARRAAFRRNAAKL